MIKTNISKNKITFRLDRTLRFLGKTEINFVYDIDISKTPVQIANYMLGILLSEHFSWNSGTFKFNKLTYNQVHSIRYHERMNRLANPYGRVKGKDARIVSDKLVGFDKPDGSGPTLVCNGMGKDGLATACLGHELTGNIRLFTVGNQYSNESIWNERKHSMKGFTDTFKIPNTHYIMTDYLQGVGYKIIPWWVIGLPLAYALNSDTMLVGSDMAYSKNVKGTKLLLRPNISIFSLDQLTKHSGITVSSPTNPLTACGVQKLLVDRYPEALPFQRSCMRGNGMSWCGKCEDCYKTALYMENADRPPSMLCIPDSERYPNKVKVAIMNHMVHDVVTQMRRRQIGLNYRDYYLKANDNVFPLIWAGDKIKYIYKEHFKIDKKDPGSDNIGYEYLPSKWGMWCNEGLC